MATAAQKTLGEFPSIKVENSEKWDGRDNAQGDRKEDRSDREVERSQDFRPDPAEKMRIEGTVDEELPVNGPTRQEHAFHVRLEIGEERRQGRSKYGAKRPKS